MPLSLRTARRLLVISVCLGSPALPPGAWGAPKAGPVTPPEAEAFSDSLVQAAEIGDAAKFNALIDWDALVTTSMKGVDAPEKFREGFRKGVLGSARGRNAFFAQVLDEIKKGGTYRVVRRPVRDKGATALIRLASPGGGVNYHKYILGRAADGNVRAVDIYIFFSGELVSQTVRRTYLQGVAEENQGFLARLAGAERVFVKSMARVPEIQRLIAEGKHREALAILDAMPKAVQDDKNFLLLRIRITQDLDEASYAQTIERMRVLFPKDASAEIASIDGYVLKKQFDKALAAVDRLDKSLGGDPYLQHLRASILLEAGKPAEARKASEAAVAGCPDLIDPHWTLIGIALGAKDHAATLEALKLIDGRFAIQFKDFEEVPEYASFVKSPQYAEWKAYLAAKEPKAVEPEAKP